MSVFGSGAFLAGFAQQTLKNREEAKKERALALEMGLKQFNATAAAYQKNRAVRQGKIDLANSLLSSTQYSPQQVYQAGEATGWKTADEALKFLKANAVEGTKPQGDRLVKDTKAMFGPEPQAPQPTDFVSTQPNRNPLLDVFAPRTLPSPQEVYNAAGMDSRATQGPRSSAVVPTQLEGQMGSQGPSQVNLGPSLSEARKPVSSADYSTISRQLRNQGLFPAFANPDGSMNVEMQDINKLNNNFRELETSIATNEMSKGATVDDAIQLAENKLYNISTNDSFQNITQFMLKNRKSIDAGSKVSYFEEDKDGSPIKDPQTGSYKVTPIAKDMTNVLLEYNNNPQVFESAVRAFSSISKEGTVDMAIDDANTAWLNEKAAKADSFGNNQQGFNEYMRQSLSELSPMRRKQMLLKLETLKGNIPAIDKPEGFLPSKGVPESLAKPTQQDTKETSGVQVPDLLAAQPEPQQKQDTTSIWDNLQEKARGAVSTEIARQTSKTFGANVPANPLVESVKSLVDKFSPNKIKQTIKNTLGDAYGMDLKLLNSFSPEGQLVTSKLLNAAAKRDKTLGSSMKAEIIAKLRGDPDKETLESYIKENEGSVHNKIYKDSRGKKTIGIGFNLEKSTAKEDLTKVVGPTAADDILRGRRKLHDQEAEALMRNDVQRAQEAASRVVPNYNELPDRAQKVLADMAYNLGEGGLKGFKKFLSAVENKDWDTAIGELMDSNYAFQVGPRAINNGILLAKEITTGES